MAFVKVFCENAIAAMSREIPVSSGEVFSISMLFLIRINSYPIPSSAQNTPNVCMMCDPLVSSVQQKPSKTPLSFSAAAPDWADQCESAWLWKRLGCGFSAVDVVAQKRKHTLGTSTLFGFTFIPRYFCWCTRSMFVFRRLQA